MADNEINNSNGPNTEYSFRIEEAGSIKDYYFILKNNEPIKLGDGVYGIVYKIEDINHDKFALKVLYENKIIQQDDQSITLERFKIECDSNNLIKESLRLKKGAKNINFNGIIEIKGSTKKFKKSNAFRKLSIVFSNSSINLSNFALVIPLYDYSLKDILEKGSGLFQLSKKIIPELRPMIPEEELLKLNDFTMNTFKDSNDLLKGMEKLELKSIKIDQTLSQITINSSNNSMSLSNYIINPSGYDILKSLNIRSRIITIFPYLSKIVQGLEILHDADLFHLDLKPSNVYIRTHGQELYAVIGDLGFLNNKKINPRHIDNGYKLGNELPLGTLHYRSPEQKDFFDICQVDIVNAYNRVTGVNIADAPARNDNNGFKLEISDPKFLESIIEKHDFLIFRKDKDEIAYIIDRIEFNNGDTTKATIYLQQNSDALASKFKADNNTQVVLFKNQGTRTDLFGFGAIMFDLLTCGTKSPERFYDCIRSFDTKDSKMSDIMDAYSTVATFQATDPYLVKIFSPFKDENSGEYMPIEIVGLILKCMFYQIKDNYFSYEINSKEIPPQKAIKYISNEITKIEEIISKQNHDNMITLSKAKNTESNALISPTMIKPNGWPHEKEFIKNITELSKLSVFERMIKGTWYIKNMIKLIDEKIIDHENDTMPFYFSELLPNYIDIVNEKLQITLHGYSEISYFISDLENDKIFNVISRDIFNPFIPDFIPFMRRKIRIKYVGDNENVSESRQQFTYTFIDNASNNIKIEEGDWIVYKNKSITIAKVIEQENKIELKEKIKNTKNLNDNIQFNKDLNPTKYKIKLEYVGDNENVSKSRQQFTYTFIDNASNSIKIEEGDWIVYKNKAITIAKVIEQENKIELKEKIENEETLNNYILFYKDLKPIRYYYFILGIYLYQIFFANIEDFTNDLPLFTTIIQKINDLNLTAKWNHIKLRRKHIISRIPRKIKKVLIHLVRFYQKLVLFDCNNSFYKDFLNRKVDEKNTTKAVRKKSMINPKSYANKLQEMIAQILKIKPEELDTLYYINSIYNTIPDKLKNIKISMNDFIKISNSVLLQKNNCKIIIK